MTTTQKAKSRSPMIGRDFADYIQRLKVSNQLVQIGIVNW